MSRRSARSSKSMTTPEPSVAPAARAPSKVSGKSSPSGVTNTPGGAAEQHGLQRRPSRTPPARVDERRQRHRRTAPRRRRAAPHMPETQKSFVPVDCSVPMAANAAPPSRTMSSTLTSVSTLLTTVGLPNRPDSTGNGGLLRGSPRKPSIELKSAVSSPQMYAPAPRRSSMSKRTARAHHVARRAGRRARAARARSSSRVVRQRILAADVDVAVLAAGREARRWSSPRSRANGSSSISTRSLNVPGSDSSALQTR